MDSLQTIFEEILDSALKDAKKDLSEDEVLSMAGVTTHPQKTMLKPAAFEIVLEILMDVTRQCLALCSTVHIKSRISGFELVFFCYLFFKNCPIFASPSTSLVKVF